MGGLQIPMAARLPIRECHHVCTRGHVRTQIAGVGAFKPDNIASAIAAVVQNVSVYLLCTWSFTLAADFSFYNVRCDPLERMQVQKERTRGSLCR